MWIVTLNRNVAEMSLLRELLREDSKISMMRLISLLCVLIAGGIAIAGMWSNKPLADVAILASAFLVPGVTGKCAQKYFENAKVP